MEEWRVRPTEGEGGAAGLSVINSYTLQNFGMASNKICFLFAGFQWNPGRSVVLTLTHTHSYSEFNRPPGKEGVI